MSEDSMPFHCPNCGHLNYVDPFYNTQSNNLMFPNFSCANCNADFKIKWTEMTTWDEKGNQDLIVKMDITMVLNDSDGDQL